MEISNARSDKKEMKSGSGCSNIGIFNELDIGELIIGEQIFPAFHSRDELQTFTVVYKVKNTTRAK